MLVKFEKREIKVMETYIKAIAGKVAEVEVSETLDSIKSGELNVLESATLFSNNFMSITWDKESEAYVIETDSEFGAEALDLTFSVVMPFVSGFVAIAKGFKNIVFPMFQNFRNTYFAPKAEVNAADYQLSFASIESYNFDENEYVEVEGFQYDGVYVAPEETDKNGQKSRLHVIVKGGKMYKSISFKLAGEDTQADAIINNNLADFDEDESIRNLGTGLHFVFGYFNTNKKGQAKVTCIDDARRIYQLPDLCCVKFSTDVMSYALEVDDSDMNTLVLNYSYNPTNRDLTVNETTEPYRVQDMLLDYGVKVEVRQA